MEYFDEEIKKEDKEKKIYEEAYSKQIKFSKKLLLIIFSIIGGIFLVIGLSVIAIEIEMAMVFIGIGVFYLILALIFYFALPQKGNFERYKKRVSKMGVLNVYELNARILILEERNKMLEDKVEELERQIKNIKY